MVIVSGWRQRRWSWKPPVVAFLLLPLSTCGARYAYGHWWWAGGTSLADLVSPGIWVAHLQFANDHTYHAEARRWQGHWAVTIEPAESR